MSGKLWLGLWLVLMVRSLAVEPVETVQRLSGFRQVDVARLLAGEVLTERGALMDFPNGISAQSCFAVALPAEEVARRLQVWNPTAHAELKVSAFNAVAVPCRPADFTSLQLTATQKSVRWLVEKTLATTPAKSSLHLSRAEAEELAGSLATSTSSQRITEYWSKLLTARATAFQQQGWDGIAPYEGAGKATSAVTQLRALLNDQSAVAREFAPVLRKAELLGHAADAKLVPFYYWRCFEANHHATLSLGAVYRLAVGERYQVVDVEYYVSGDYYAAVTLYEIWPVTGGALVWRVDLFAAPMLEYTKGMERLAYEVLMVQDIKQWTRCLLDDLKVKR